ncbi:hypothetical protein JG688_00002996 [Phytophthora aleatoria]|uniref:Kinetochore protein NDC80 n=1 Tax=Phytophthora aleatoria TaxID=2496075 RepID=A0A8J5IUS5_9STRA|nr:hypothetical protein JG688_00002996 [Phytophthora aleatoria]
MRRTTLGPVSSSQLNARPSALRHPSSRVSVPSKSMAATERQSIGVASRRVTMAAGTTGRPPTGPRASMNPRQSVGNRRNSSYSSRASVQGRGARVVDPRPVHDRSFLNSCVQTLVEFLSDHMYDQVLPPALARRGPSKKDFTNMILFLFKQVDPTFEFGAKFEEDVVQQLRNLRYPISISKTSLAAVGTPHTWPMLLMAMSWLIELLSYDEAIQQANEAEQDDENDEENGDKPFFKYLDASYHIFLAGEDEKYDALERHEREKLIARNEAVKQETSELEQYREELKRRIEKAKRDKNALAELTSMKTDCESDLLKFRKLVKDYEKTKVKLGKKLESLVDVQQSCEELGAVQKLTHRLKTEIRHAALQLKQNRVARANAGLDDALELDEDLQKCENQLNIEIESEKLWESKVKNYAEQMLVEREKRVEYFRRKTAATEEVEKKITSITNGDNLVEEEAMSRQHLLDVRKASAEMKEGYQALLDRNERAVTHVLTACINHKDMVDRAISSLEAEVNKVEL